MSYPNQYDYTITITIPDGYTADGLSSLNIDKSYKSKSTGEQEQIVLTEELSIPSKDISEFDFDSELSTKNMAQV